MNQGPPQSRAGVLRRGTLPGLVTIGLFLNSLPGVRVAGLMLEASSAGNVRGSSLLEWGAPDSDDPGDAGYPGVLSDVFARVGGAERDASVDAMVRLHSGNVYGDNLWLWRADHVQLGKDEAPNFPRISRKYRQTVRGECEPRTPAGAKHAPSRVCDATGASCAWNGLPT